ncbi:MAG: branched-chain amino acid ABC transporter permease [Rhodovarius sp.]|nr:branched-chain amino acid ABC transporter permease [Rhodovarius sp.]
MSAERPFRIARASSSSRIGLGLLGLLFLLLAAAPWWAGRQDLRLLAEIYAYIALASLWNLLAGYAGLVSVGQQAFVGLGGYALFALALFGGVGPLWTIPLAGLIGALVAVPVALLVFRLRGAYFAIGTWVVAEVFRLLASQISSLGGGSGTSLPAAVVTSIAATRHAREQLVYWVALGLLVLVLGAVVLLLRSRHGLALAAVRDDEVAAGSCGVEVGRTKLLVYVLAAGGAAMLGALIFLQKLRISPDAAFSVNDWTAVVIFIAVIGGLGRVEGPIIGTLVYFLLRETLAPYGSLYLLVLGVVAIAVMLFARQGIWGAIADRTGWHLFPLERRVILPARSSSAGIGRPAADPHRAHSFALAGLIGGAALVMAGAQAAADRMADGKGPWAACRGPESCCGSPAQPDHAAMVQGRLRPDSDPAARGVLEPPPPQSPSSCGGHARACRSPNEPG